MASKIKRLTIPSLSILALACSLSLGAAAAEGTIPAAPIAVRGEGATYDDAIKSALRHAVEQKLGVHVMAMTAVENLEVVKNDIVSHAAGYVRHYDVLRQGTDGAVAWVEIAAEVDDGTLENSAESLAALMKMVGHPTVLVVAVEDGFDTVSTVLPEFGGLAEQVESVLRDQFAFATLDRKGLPARGQGLSRREALSAARQAGAAYAVLVSLSRTDRTRSAQLRLEAVRCEDGALLGQDVQSGEVPSGPATHSSPFVSVQERVYPATVSIARALTTTVQESALSADGTRFAVEFRDLPPDRQAAIEAALAGLAGIVRVETASQMPRRVQLWLWSRQSGDALAGQLAALLADQHVTARQSRQGNAFRVEYVDPIFK